MKNQLPEDENNNNNYIVGKCRDTHMYASYFYIF